MCTYVVPTHIYGPLLPVGACIVDSSVHLEISCHLHVLGHTGVLTEQVLKRPLSRLLHSTTWARSPLKQH